MRYAAATRLVLPLLLLLALLSACDSALERAPGRDRSTAVAQQKGDAFTGFRFGYADERPPGGGMHFPATVLTRRPDGQWDRREGWAWFSASVMKEAGGRTLPFRLALEDRKSAISQVLVATVPQAPGVSETVSAWFRSVVEGEEAGLKSWRWDCDVVTYYPSQTEYWQLGCHGTPDLPCVATRCTAVWEEEEWEGSGGGGPWSPGEGCTDPAVCGPGSGGGVHPPPDECNPYMDSECDFWPRVEARAVHDWYMRRGGMDGSPQQNEARRNELFEYNIIKTFGATSDSRSSNSLPSGYKPLGGFLVHNGYITHI